MRRLIVALAGAALLMGCGSAVSGTASPIVPLAAPAPAPAPDVADPASIEIPRIGASSTLEPTGRTPEGGWEVPALERPEQASWFRPGPEPGEPGPAVVLGHVNGSGRPGVFARLTELAPGDRVGVTDVEGLRREFVVTEIRHLGKARYSVPDALAPGDAPELRLITCGGEFDRATGSYTDNVIVFARLA